MNCLEVDIGVHDVSDEVIAKVFKTSKSLPPRGRQFFFILACFSTVADGAS